MMSMMRKGNLKRLEKVAFPIIIEIQEEFRSFEWGRRESMMGTMGKVETLER